MIDTSVRKLNQNIVILCMSFFLALIQVHQQWTLASPAWRFVEYFALNNCILLAFSITRLTFKPFLYIYIFTSSLLWAVKIKMDIDVGNEAVMAFFEATRSEALGFVGKNLAIIIIYAFLLMLGVIWMPLKKRGRSEWKIFVLLWLVQGVLLLFVVFNKSVFFRKSACLFQQVIPNNFFVGIKEYIKIKHYFTLNTQRKNITNAFKADHLTQQPLTVVLVIGESARSDRFGINGYNRNTTPLLQKVPNLLTWPNTTACGIITWYSVPCLLSRLGQDTFRFPNQELSLVSVMRDFGFHTYFFSVQNTKKNPTIYQICQEAEKCTYDDTDLTMDWPLLDQLETTLQNDRAPRRLIILHQLGSHFYYASRYPESHAYFKPACPGAAIDCSREETDNAYDNSIRYTDFILASTIKRLAHTRALVIYTSDHGEALGEFGRYGHGSLYTFALKVQKEVPFFIWFSKPLLDDPVFQKRYQAALKHQKSGQKISHDYLFYTALGCSGITSKNGRNKLNLCA